MSAAPPSSVTSSSSASLLESARHRRALGIGLSLLVFGLALVACYHLAREIHPSALHEALLRIPLWSLGGALLLTALSFAALIGYEWSGCRYAGVQLPARMVAGGGFCAFAVGNAVGLSMFSGGAVRYRLYSRYGLTAIDIGRISLFTSLSLAICLPLLAALAALMDLPSAALALRVSEGSVQNIALAIIALYGFLAGVVYWHRLPEAPSPDCLLIRAGRASLRLPALRLSMLQLLVTVLDVAAAAGVLYLLLPEAPSFGAFLLVYLLALAAGVLSHVPGGVGVFEAIMLAVFSAQMDPASLAAALLLYRVIYMLLPLLAACLLLLVSEARRVLPAPSAQTRQIASSLAAPILSLLVFLGGIVLLFSGVTPSIDVRLENLGFLVPDQLVNASHFAASLVGVLCMLLANGLWRRLSAAWMLTLVLLCSGAVFSLLKGFDWEEAIILTLIALLLAVFRPAFYRPSRVMQQPLAPACLLASTCVVATSIGLLLFAYQDIPYSNQLWWQFALDDDAPRGLRAALGSGLVLVVVILTWLLRAKPPVVLLPTPDELERAWKIVQSSNQPDGGLALTGDKALLFHPREEAFLMYARRGRSLVALFDPIGANSLARAELIWQFRDLCDLYHNRPVFYQVRPENLPFYMDIGLTAVKLGEEARVNLSQFTLETKCKEMKDLRYTLSRGQRDGLVLDFYAPGAAPLEELKSISDAWLDGKQVREKGFSLGRFTTSYLNYFPMVVARHQGQAVAFANLLETQSQTLASLDLMRVHPDAPKLTMEFLMLGLILEYQKRGYAQFSLGMVPLSGLQPRRGAPLSQRLGALVFQRGESFYNFQGLRRFKEKFQPSWEPRYLAVPSGLDPLVAMADTAALIAGGLTGLVKR